MVKLSLGDYMPNWCDCELRVYGKKEELKRFIEFAKSKEKILDEEKFIPYPKKFKDMDKKAKMAENNSAEQDKVNTELKRKDLTDIERAKLLKKKKRLEIFAIENMLKEKVIKDGFNSGGYDWCVQNYGTKWGLCDVVLVEQTDKRLFYSTQTAWSPPTPIIIKMGELFNKLKFNLRYYEGGMGYKGVLKIEKGKVIEHKESNQYRGGRGG